MHNFFYYPLCPFSRSIRLLLAECSIDIQLVEEKPWEWRHEFLSFNPSGRLPVLVAEDGTALCGHYAISEFVSETDFGAVRGGSAFVPFPGGAQERAEIRRIVDWFHDKFWSEVSEHLFEEKIAKRFVGGPPEEPNLNLLRAGFKNLDYHMSYIDFLAGQRGWLGGQVLSFADFAAAGHVSFVDYLNDVPWDGYPQAREWFARIKSRPAYRSILGDRVGWMKPPAHYADPDF